MIAYEIHSALAACVTCNSNAFRRAAASHLLKTSPPRCHRRRLTAYNCGRRRCGRSASQGPRAPGPSSCGGRPPPAAASTVAPSSCQGGACCCSPAAAPTSTAPRSKVCPHFHLLSRTTSAVGSAACACLCIRGPAVACHNRCWVARSQSRREKMSSLQLTMFYVMHPHIAC